MLNTIITPKLPKLECKVSGYKENNSRRFSTRPVDHITMPRELIESVNASYPYDDAVDIEEISNWKQRGICSAFYKGQVGKSYKHEWQLVKDNRKSDIYRHVQDGLATFASLDKIAVFFLRCDSEGEGGSGQR